VSPLVFSFNTEIIVGLDIFIYIMINFLNLIFTTHLLPITLKNQLLSMMTKAKASVFAATFAETWAFI